MSGCKQMQRRQTKENTRATCVEKQETTRRQSRLHKRQEIAQQENIDREEIYSSENVDSFVVSCLPRITLAVRLR